MEEIIVPLTAEDFEPGDNVYRVDTKYGTIMFAKVTAIEAPGIHLLSDDGVPYAIHEKRFGVDPHPFFIWGKMMDVEKLEEGSRLSIVEHRQRRYATVVSFRPPRSYRPGYIELSWDDDNAPNYSLELKDALELDKTMVYWEMEE